MIAREVDDVTARKLQEGIASDNGNDKSIPSSKASSSANSTTTSWTRLKDPRIVRVSRAFGGKDRHSKVCTVRGLRDRRVRLSVPTAIQLYDLQDRLGLNQPSKVVDWLLNAAKHEIDELPPLQMPPTGNFNPNLHPILANYHGLLGTSNNSQSSKEGLNLNSNNNSSSSSINWDLDPLEQSRSNSLNCDAILRSKSKDVITETTNDHQKDQNICSLENHGHYHNNILHRSPNDSYLQVPYSSFLKWDPSSLSLAQSGSSTHHGTAIQQPENIIHNFNGLALPSTVSVQLGSQVLVHPQGFPQSFFHPHNISGASDAGQFDPKEINFQMLSSGSENPMSHSDHSFRPSIDSTSQSVRPFHFLRSQNSTEGREPNKDMEFHSN